MSARDDGGPAFPLVTGIESLYDGMSLRDYFAAHAPPMPQGLREIVNLSAKRDEGKGTFNFGLYAKWEAEWRSCYADAMLKERAK